MKMKLGQWLVTLQRSLLPHQKLIKNFLRGLQFGVLLIAVAVSLTVINNPTEKILLASTVGSLLGQAAVWLFCLTLIPGILQRLRWQQAITAPFASIIILFRRQIGVLMFLTAFAHFTLTSTLPRYILTGSVIPTTLIRTFELMGMIAWAILVPVWLTSNDPAMRFLGRKWKLVQRLTYVSIWFMLFHVALQGELLSVVIGLTAVLEILSWLVFYRRSSK